MIRWVVVLALPALLVAPPCARAATIAGTVRDTSGAPLAGAIVRPWRAATEPSPGTRCGNCWPDCARRATTDAAGRFTLERLDDSLHFVLLVHASGFVPKLVPDVFPAHGSVDVIARVAFGADPFSPRARLRAPLDILGGFEPARVRTDADGAFELPHLPSGVEYVLYVPMVDFAAHGGAPLLHVRAPGDDSASAPVELAGSAPRRVRGRVLRPDGSPPPARTAISITRRDDGLGRLFDTVGTPTDSLGRFEYAALPAGDAEVGLFWLYGWRVAGADPAWGGLPGGAVRIAGRGDVDVELKLEPRPR